MNKILFKILRFSGLPYLFRELIQSRKVSILMFHDISPEIAEKSFKYLANKYNLIDLNDFINAYKTQNKALIPKKAMIITFDDGHKGNHALLPIIQEFRVPMTIFLCASIINTNRHYWFLHENERMDIPGLKKLPNKERLQILKNLGFEQTKEFDKVQALQREEIEEMKPYINFQAHTSFHPILPNCEDQVAYDEIMSCKKSLEKEYHFNINSFAYPNGDYTDREVKYLKETGYECAITTKFGFNSLTSDMFRLNRLSANDTSDMNELIVKSSGLWGFLKSML